MKHLKYLFIGFVILSSFIGTLYAISVYTPKVLDFIAVLTVLYVCYGLGYLVVTER
jgi:hypothetical protein